MIAGSFNLSIIVKYTVFFVSLPIDPDWWIGKRRDYDSMACEVCKDLAIERNEEEN